MITNRLPIKLTIDTEDLDSDDEVPAEIFQQEKVKEGINKAYQRPKVALASTIDPGLSTVGHYIDTNPGAMKIEKKTTKLNETEDKVKELAAELTQPDKLMEKSVIKPGFEKLEAIPSYAEGRRRLKLQRRKEAEKTKGDKWFNLPATEMTEEKARDLEVIQMRSILNPKQFYKKNDLKVLPKYFQVGKVVDSAADFYSGRVPKKQRKKTLVDELMADANFQKYNKRKYAEIIQTKSQSQSSGAHKHSRRLKKRK